MEAGVITFAAHGCTHQRRLSGARPANTACVISFPGTPAKQPISLLSKKGMEQVQFQILSMFVGFFLI